VCVCVCVCCVVLCCVVLCCVVYVCVSIKSGMWPFVRKNIDYCDKNGDEGLTRQMS
jgi:hypothetical protein